LGINTLKDDLKQKHRIGYQHSERRFEAETANWVPWLKLNAKFRRVNRYKQVLDRIMQLILVRNYTRQTSLESKSFSLELRCSIFSFLFERNDDDEERIYCPTQSLTCPEKGKAQHNSEYCLYT